MATIPPPNAEDHFESALYASTRVLGTLRTAFDAMLWNAFVLYVSLVVDSIVTSANFEQLANALTSIFVTLLGMSMDVNPLQYLNTSLAISVTLFGMVTLVKDVQKENV